MILSIVMIIVTTFDPFFLLVLLIIHSEVCIKSLAKVTHSVECLSVQTMWHFYSLHAHVGKKSDLHPNAPL